MKTTDRKNKIRTLIDRVNALQVTKSNPLTVALSSLEKQINKIPENEEEIRRLSKTIIEVKKYLESKNDETKGSLSQEIEKAFNNIKETQFSIVELSDNNIESIFRELSSIKKELDSKLSEVWESKDKSEKSLTENIKSVRDEIVKVLKTLESDIQKIETSEKKMKDRLAEELSATTETLKKEFDEKIKKINTDFIERISSIENRGGGSPNQRISIGGTVMSKKYADINLIGSITASDNNTTKQVDITFAGGSSYMTPDSGKVNGSNTVFVWDTAPSIIFVDGVPRQKTSSDGTENWTGTTTTTLSVAPNFDIFGL